MACLTMNIIEPSTTGASTFLTCFSRACNGTSSASDVLSKPALLLYQPVGLTNKAQKKHKNDTTIRVHNVQRAPNSNTGCRAVMAFAIGPVQIGCRTNSCDVRVHNADKNGVFLQNNSNGMITCRKSSMAQSTVARITCFFRMLDTCSTRSAHAVC